MHQKLDMRENVPLAIHVFGILAFWNKPPPKKKKFENLISVPGT